MPALSPIDPATATGKTAELLAQVQKETGSIGNMMKVMANSPTLLKTWLTLHSVVGAGHLPAATRERLAIATAQLNGCEYCLSAHTFLGGRVAKLDKSELDAARRGESADPHVSAILKLSTAIAANGGAVEASEIDTARAAGVTDDEIGEVVANLTLNTLTNYFNVLADVENDWPVVQL